MAQRSLVVFCAVAQPEQAGCRGFPYGGADTLLLEDKGEHSGMCGMPAHIVTFLSKCFSHLALAKDVNGHVLSLLLPSVLWYLRSELGSVSAYVHIVQRLVRVSVPLQGSGKGTNMHLWHLEVQDLRQAASCSTLASVSAILEVCSSRLLS